MCSVDRNTIQEGISRYRSEAYLITWGGANNFTDKNLVRNFTCPSRYFYMFFEIIFCIWPRLNTYQRCTSTTLLISMGVSSFLYSFPGLIPMTGFLCSCLVLYPWGVSSVPANFHTHGGSIWDSLPKYFDFHGGFLCA